MLAAWAAPVLVEPFFQAVVVEDLLTVVALDVLLLDDVEADWAEEGVHEFLVGLHRVFFRHLVVPRQLKDEIVCDLLNLSNEVSRLLLHVVFKPSHDSEGPAVVDHAYHVLLCLNH